MDDLLADPGELALEGALPQDNQGSDPIENLSPTFPTLSLPANFTQPATISSPFFMDTSSTGGDGSTDSGITDSSLESSLLSFGESAGDSLLGAFVLAPQNATTAEGIADNNASNALASTSQIFGFLIIGVIAFLIFTAVEK